MRCANCGAPAIVLHTRTGEELCERCARDRTASERGESYAACRVLDTAIALMREASMTDDEIAAAVKLRLGTDDLTEFTGSGRDGGDPEWLGGFDYDDRLVRLDG